MADDTTQAAALPPLLAIWRRPGRTVAALAKEGKGHSGALIIAALFGVLNARRWLIVENGGAGGLSVNWPAVPLVLPAAALAGCALLFFYAWLFRNFGRWMGGTGTLRAVRTGMGWSLLPGTVVLALAFVFPTATWLTLTEGPGGEPAAVFTTPGYLLFAAFIYAYGVFLVGSAASHKLPVLRAFAALAIAFLVSIIPLSVLVQALGID